MNGCGRSVAWQVLAAAFENFGLLCFRGQKLTQNLRDASILLPQRTEQALAYLTTTSSSCRARHIHPPSEEPHTPTHKKNTADMLASSSLPMAAPSSLSRRPCCAVNASLCVSSTSGRAALRTTPAARAPTSRASAAARAVLTEPAPSVDPMGKANDTGVYIKGKVLTIRAPEVSVCVLPKNGTASASPADPRRRRPEQWPGSERSSVPAAF